MMEWVDLLQYEFSERAIGAALMIGLMNGYLGAYIVLQRSSLYVGGLTHTLFPGIALGAILAGLNPGSALVGALVMALLLSLMSTGIASFSRIDKETALAILYTACFGGGVLLLKHIETYVDIESYLFGNILGVSDVDLWFVYGAGWFSISGLILFQRPLLLYIFSREAAAAQGLPVERMGYALSALLVLVMITSLLAVGAILTLGLLIAPAAIMYLFSNSSRVIMLGGALLGAVLSVLCVVLSFVLDAPTGPVIVSVLGVLFVLAFVLSPENGLLAHVLKKRYMKQN